MTNALTVEFRFRLFQSVRIVPLMLEGQVLARCDRSDGFHEYRVIFWSEGKRYDDWLTDAELDEPRNNGHANTRAS